MDRRDICGKRATRGLVYACRKCDAWVGVHPGTAKAMGRLANRELRFWKREAHVWFDGIWQRKIHRGANWHDARSSAYRWLSRTMGIDAKVCHIGMFDVLECKRVVAICKLYISKKAKRKKRTDK